jgi:hypothetical protein
MSMAMMLFHRLAAFTIATLLVGTIKCDLTTCACEVLAHEFIVKV